MFLFTSPLPVVSTDVFSNLINSFLSTYIANTSHWVNLYKWCVYASAAMFNQTCSLFVCSFKSPKPSAAHPVLISTAFNWFSALQAEKHVLLSEIHIQITHFVHSCRTFITFSVL